MGNANSAPFLLFVESGDQDAIFPVEASRESFERVKKVYSVFDKRFQARRPMRPARTVAACKVSEAGGIGCARWDSQQIDALIVKCTQRVVRFESIARLRFSSIGLSDNQILNNAFLNSTPATTPLKRPFLLTVTPCFGTYTISNMSPLVMVSLKHSRNRLI